MSLPAAATMLRLNATASIARTCRRPQLQLQQQSRSLFCAAVLPSKLDKLLPQVEDFPSRHIGPRRHDAKDMLRILGFNVSLRACEFTQPQAHIRAHIIGFGYIMTKSLPIGSLWMSSPTQPFLPTLSWTGRCTWRNLTVSSTIITQP